MGTIVSEYGVYNDCKVDKVTLTNANGTTAEFLTLGTIWHAFTIKNAQGKPVDVVVGPQSFHFLNAVSKKGEAYKNETSYSFSIIN